jgi:glycosyltransferase involved in cell wall biosynthesis
MPSLLLVTYEFPPKGGVGVQRPLKTARFLAEAGWDVTVLTVADPPASLLDPDLLAGLPASVRVERAWSLEPTRIVGALKRRRSRGAGDLAPARDAAGGSRGVTGLPRGVVRFVQAFFIPDEKFWWTPWAVRLGRRLHGETPFDCILASGPPFTALGIARRLSRSLRVPWVADLRDPIVGGYFFRPLTPVHAALMRAYERRVVRSAARVIVATDGMRAELAERHPEAAAHIVTVRNGFDPADLEGPAPAARSGFTVSYVGTFQGAITADTLLAAFARARQASETFARDARIRLVGPLDPQTASAIERRGLGDAVDRVGFVGHQDAIAEMLAASVLVLVLGDVPESRHIITGKLPEYLGAGRPVLALVPDGPAADIVRRSGAGWVVPPADAEGAAAALLEAHGLWAASALPAPDPGVVRSFDRRELVARVGSLLEEVISHGA